MPGVMVHSTMLGFLCVGFFFSLIGSEEPWQQVETEEYARSCPWTCMVFVQMWPGSFCVALAKRFECVMPKNATVWTIHGLWPCHVMTCWPSWRLFPSDLVDLKAELSWQWPTLLKNLTNFQFWEQEWHKHGTCAVCLETLSSPQKYFGAALFLRTKYHIDRAFQRAAIAPSCKSRYQLDTFLAVLRPILGGEYELQCVTDVQGRQILVQLKVSLYSNFSTGCIPELYDKSPYRPCHSQKPVFYFPPNWENPRNPCP